MQCKVKILKPLEGVYPEYQPEVGKVYDADYRKSRKGNADFAVIDIKDKRIIVRMDEFELINKE